MHQSLGHITSAVRTEVTLRIRNILSSDLAHGCEASGKTPDAKVGTFLQ
jgi:hypothetical protein